MAPEHGESLFVRDDLVLRLLGVAAISAPDRFPELAGRELIVMMFYLYCYTSKQNEKEKKWIGKVMKDL